MPFDVESLAAINASPLPYDLFRAVHKGIRRAVFTVVAQAGSADWADPAERQAVLRSTGRLIDLLAVHHRHEDVHVQPLLERHAATVAAMLHESHAEIDSIVEDLTARVAALGRLSGSDASVKGLDLYRGLAVFAAVYLAHLAFEEGEAMAALREALNIGDLCSIETAIRASMTPDETCDLIAEMAPALNIEERAALIAGLQATSPGRLTRADAGRGRGLARPGRLPGGAAD